MICTVSIQLALILVVVPRALKLLLKGMKRIVLMKMNAQIEIRVRIMLPARIQLDLMNVYATLDMKVNSVQMLMSVPELQSAMQMLIVSIP